MTMTVYVKVLGSQCHCSMYYCCCCIPEIHVLVSKLCRPIIYQDKHDQLSKTATLVLAELLQNLRIFQFLNYLSEASCDELCCIRIFCMIHIPMRSSHNSIIHSGKQAIFFRPHRGILNTVQQYTYSFYHNCYQY